MKHIKTWQIFESNDYLDSLAIQFINDLSKKWDLRLGKPFDKEKANCAWFTTEFVNWSKTNSLDVKIIYFDDSEEAHIAPYIDGFVLDFTIKQFTKNPDDNYLITKPEDYREFGYLNFEIIDELPSWLTIKEADRLREVNENNSQTDLFELITMNDYLNRQDSHGSDIPFNARGPEKSRAINRFGTTAPGISEETKIRNFLKKEYDDDGLDFSVSTGVKLELTMGNHLGDKKFVQLISQSPDEWFYVKEYFYVWYKGERHSSWRQVSYRAFEDSENVYESYFKCDSLDGLFEFIKNRKKRLETV